MPASSEILAGLTRIAEQGRGVGIGWHAVLAGVLLALVAGWRPGVRALGLLLAAPLASVSLLAFFGGVPFNGAVFAVLAVAVFALTVARRDGLQLSSRWWAVSVGAALVTFAWVYPHFVDAQSWFYAAPLGVLPCPTLALVVGVTLMFDGLGAAWAWLVAAAGLFYGISGVAQLGVQIDVAVVAGATALAASAIAGVSPRGVGRPSRS